MNRCLYCDKEISDKSKYCSDAHRKAYTRRTQAGHEPGQNDKEFNPDTRDLSDLDLTRTDSLFEASKPNYYKFSEQVFKSKCLECRVEFKTHLKLLRFCSPKHMFNALDGLSGRGQ